MYDLSSFGFNDMMELRSEMRRIFDEAGPSTLEEAAQRIVDLFRTQLVDGEGRPACALVRLFKTHQFMGLDNELKTLARAAVPVIDNILDLRCLVLVATAGDEPAWNSRHLSKAHRVIPLSSRQAVDKAPMIAQLFQQLGVNVTAVLRPDPRLFLDTPDNGHNLFYVQNAVGSPYIVAQDFVQRHGIQSVVGFGGLLASGDLIATILFSKVPISPETADLFKVIGLNFKLAMMKVAGKPLFMKEI
jgi:hypothetical protein